MIHQVGQARSFTQGLELYYQAVALVVSFGFILYKQKRNGRMRLSSSSS